MRTSFGEPTRFSSKSRISASTSTPISPLPLARPSTASTRLSFVGRSGSGRCCSEGHGVNLGRHSKRKRASRLDWSKPLRKR